MSGSKLDVIRGLRQDLRVYQALTLMRNLATNDRLTQHDKFKRKIRYLDCSHAPRYGVSSQSCKVGPGTLESSWGEPVFSDCERAT
jgi:hypothetical protein